MDTSSKTVITFVAGLLVGGVALYLTPAPDTPPPLASTTGGGAVGVVPPGTQPGPGPLAVPGVLPGTPPLGTPPDGSTPLLPPLEPGSSQPILPPGAEVPTVEAPDPPLINDARLLTQGGSPAMGIPRLQDHLGTARGEWLKLADEYDGHNNPDLRALAPEMRRVSGMVPQPDNRYPPLQDVVAVLVEERLLVDRIRQLGGDARDLGREVDTVLQHEVGKVPDGARIRAERLARENGGTTP